MSHLVSISIFFRLYIRHHVEFVERLSRKKERKSFALCTHTHKHHQFFFHFVSHFGFFSVFSVFFRFDNLNHTISIHISWLFSEDNFRLKMTKPKTENRKTKKRKTRTFNDLNEFSKVKNPAD